MNSTSLPGQNGNPTFAAVAAGYDKSPGVYKDINGYLNKTQCNVISLFIKSYLVCVCARVFACAFTGGSGPGKAECLGKGALPHMTSVESDSSDRQVNRHDIPCPDAY